VSQSDIERLSRFTPDRSNLDRDALLYAAGQASVRPNLVWPSMASLLAISQFVMIGVFWQRPTPVQQVAMQRSIPTLMDTSEPVAAPESAELWVLNRQLLESPTGDLPSPASVEISAGSEPPLRAIGLPARLD
jgi:hypothetical protein